METDPLGNATVHGFGLLGSSCNGYETETDYYQGSVESTHLLKKVTTSYRSINDPWNVLTGGSGVTNVFPTVVTTTWPSGKSSRVETDYDNNLSFTVPGVSGAFSGSYGEVMETREFDYDGTLKRRIDYTYKAFDGSPQAASFLAFNLLDRIGSITTYDGSGAQIAKVTYGYDECCLQPSGVTTQLDTTSPVVRGNRTSESHWLNTTGGMLTTTTQYYDTGTPYKITDPGLHTTTNTYGAGFQSGINFAGAYVTQTQNALLQSAFVDYDFNTALPLFFQDANLGLTTSTYDLYHRILTKTVPDRGFSQWSYNDSQPPSFTATSGINPSLTFSVEGDLDGLGRTTHSKVTSDPSGTDTVDTTYDALGRVSTVSNPHRPTSSPTDGITSTVYDALGRVTATVYQDGSSSTTDYSQFPIVTVTDAAGKDRRSRIDALGRLVEVDEPPVTAVSAANSTATLQSDGNFVLNGPTGQALWSTGTSGTPDGPVYVQNDGNLVLYDFRWQVGTYRASNGSTLPPSSCSVGDTLFVGQRLSEGQCLFSATGMTFAQMNNGELQIYDHQLNQLTWVSGTYGHPGSYALMQSDGRLAIYDVNGALLWSSTTLGTGTANIATLQADGRLIIYSTAWSANTAQSPVSGSIAYPSCYVGNGIGITGTLYPGNCVVSENGYYELLMQTDGNMVLYDRSITPSRQIWSTKIQLEFAPAVTLQTLYSYDGLNNLTRVEQHGGTTDSSKWRIRTFTYDSLSRLLTATNPESGTISYSYDADGNLLQKTSPAPNALAGSTSTQIISYCYDALHRMTGKAYSQQTCVNGLLPSGTAVVSYYYDQTSSNGLTITAGIGRRTGMADQAGTEAWSYDPMGRPLFDRRTIAGVTKTTGYLYDSMGNVTYLTYPSGAVVGYSYNGANQATSAIDTGNSINYATLGVHDPTGALTSVTNGANITSVFYDNPRLQPCRTSVSAGSPTPSSCTDSPIGNVMDFTYNFGAAGTNNGNVVSISNNRDTTRSQSFTYDTLNRIGTAQTGATTGTHCWGEIFGYDGWGNLLSLGGITPQYSGCTQESGFGVGASSLNQVSTYLYDAAGNMTTGGYTYDAENRISSVGGVTYTYDGDGKRVEKSSGKIYWYGMGSDLLDETDMTGSTANSGFNEYAFFGGKRTARRNSSNAVFYYFADHLGTSRTMVQSGQITVCYDADFYPFGGERTIVNTCPQNYKFTGKERDMESGLDYFGARYFPSTMGRFMSPDPGNVGVKIENPQSWNMYSYSLNNPLAFTDPTGMYVCEDSTECNSTNDQNFAKALAAAQAAVSNMGAGADKDSAQRAIDAYGAKGVDNGVNVRFDANISEPAGVTEVSGIANGNKSEDNRTGQNINVTFKPDAMTGDYAGGVAAHEGSHVADASAWVSSGFAAGKNPTSNATELRAYQVMFNVMNGIANTIYPSSRYASYNLSISYGSERVDWQKGDSFKLPEFKILIKTENGSRDSKPAFTSGKGAAIQP